MLHTCMFTFSWLSIVLVGGGVEEDNGENIQVPHAVGPCEKGTVDLEIVLSPVPRTFTDLVKNRVLAPWSCENSILWCNYHKHSSKELHRGVIPTWFMMKKMTVMAAHARVTSIKNLNLKIIPCIATQMFFFCACGWVGVCVIQIVMYLHLSTN